MIKITDLNGQKATNVCNIIKLHGKEAWLVGGAIRDLLMGRTPSDYDIATNAAPDQIMRWFPRVVPTGIKHGTVTVLDGEHQYEVTTFRGESGYSNGRSPDMTYPVHTIEEDLSRRDFTVNALAYDPIADKFCDPYGGAADILLKRIRCVGDPMDRFREDGLRCLRAARFAATLGFNIDQRTFLAMDSQSAHETYKKVSVERIVQEYRKGIKSQRPSVMFELLSSCGLLWETIPEFLGSAGCTQNKYHAYDVWAHTMHVLDACPKNELIQFAALFHDVAKKSCKGTNTKTGEATFYNHEEVGADMTRTIMTRLKFPTAEIDKVCTLVRHHLLPHNDVSSAALRRWVIRVGAENVDEILDLAQADLEGKGPAKETIPYDFVSKFRDRVKELSVKQPVVSKVGQLAVHGHDLLEIFKLKPGPWVGKTLKSLLDYVTEHPESNTREKLLDVVSHMSKLDLDANQAYV